MMAIPRSVYPNADQAPEAGEGLNKRSTVTLYQCFPGTEEVESYNRDKRKWRENVKQKLTQAKHGATFVDYDGDNGIWKFLVEKFHPQDQQDS